MTTETHGQTWSRLLEREIERSMPKHSLTVPKGRFKSIGPDRKPIPRKSTRSNSNVSQDYSFARGG
jgi:hypothetical protein